MVVDSWKTPARVWIMPMSLLGIILNPRSSHKKTCHGYEILLLLQYMQWCISRIYYITYYIIYIYIYICIYSRADTGGRFRGQSPSPEFFPHPERFRGGDVKNPPAEHLGADKYFLLSNHPKNTLSYDLILQKIKVFRKSVPPTVSPHWQNPVSAPVYIIYYIYVIYLVWIPLSITHFFY